MAAAEVAPLAKVGGLADVVGSLPPAVKKLGVDVRVVMPLYGSIDKKKYGLKKIYPDLEVPSGRNFGKINIYQAKLPKTSVLVYFIDCPKYFGGQEVYAAGDNSKRFLFFSLSLLYSLPAIGFKPDIIHCHDSHTALIPDILKTTNLEFLKGIKTLFTIHNFQYQGKTGTEILSTGNLSKDSLKTLSRDAQDGDINFMVQGVLNSDIITTVSPTYSKEIITKAYGEDLDNIIRKRKKDLYGIVNGIDIDFFDPRKDKFIFKNYSAKSLEKKQENKLALQKRLGLPQDKDKPMAALISRFAWQKGLELITKKLCQPDCQLVFLGTGDPKYERQLKSLARKFPKKVSANIMFDVKLAQQIYAGADIFLMPSRFEPCGLGQMIAMRYGTVPVARATGGLADTVDEKVGFKFKKFSEPEFRKTLDRALKIYYNKPEKWKRLQINCMKKDFSWDKSAREYLKLYKKLAQ